ncbi:MAG: insulinase family protein [Myxococcales bacterium]|nr:insulinase family protein [Myxococcales bacterium]
MNRRALVLRWAALLALALAVGPAPTARAGGDPELAGVPKVPFEKYVLANGLEVVLHQDRRVPLVFVSVWYHVGSGDETPGRSGFAHLFEHMMFQGSKHTGEDVHFDTLRNAGATNVNGTTNPDRTNYFEEVPSNQLEVALWLESDRMGYLLELVTQKSLDNQREVVRNERRQNYDNVPYGKDRFAITKALYPEGHPYRYLTIGRHEDLAAASLDDVKRFFRTWYVPSNATLVIAGDFETKAARQLVTKWFGAFPTTPRPEHREVSLPEATRSRTTVPDELAHLRRLHYAWHSPASYTAGDGEFDLLAHALGSDGTGRLYKLLVHEKQLAKQVMVYQASAQRSSEFHVVVDLKEGADLGVVTTLLDAELERVRSEPIAESELARAVTSIEASFIWGLESTMARGEALQAYNHFLGTPSGFARDLGRYREATAAGIRDYAARFLPPERRVEILTVPAKKQEVRP